jgi:hypothetical protein
MVIQSFVIAKYEAILGSFCKTARGNFGFVLQDRVVPAQAMVV